MPTTTSPYTIDWTKNGWQIRRGAELYDYVYYRHAEAVQAVRDFERQDMEAEDAARESREAGECDPVVGDVADEVAELLGALAALAAECKADGSLSQLQNLRAALELIDV